MYSEYIPLNTQQAYYQQPLPQQQQQQQQQQSPQQPQQHQQVINPNLNSNTNNNVPTDTREASAFSFPKPTLPTQHTHSLRMQSNSFGDESFRPPFDVQTNQFRPYYSK